MEDVRALSILYLEDESLMARRLMEDLREIGFGDVTHVRTWSALWACVRERTFDVALLDIHLGPHESADGIDAGNLLYTRHGLPVVYLTNYDTPTVMQRLCGQPWARFGLKPARARDVAALLRIAHTSAVWARERGGESDERDCVLVKSSTTWYRINFADLLYVTSTAEATQLVVRRDGAARHVPIAGSLERAMGLWGARGDIYRISRQEAVPLHAIVALDTSQLLVCAPVSRSLTISRKYWPELRSALLES